MSGHTLILMRHARQAGTGARDHENPLTTAGREDARRVGRRLLEAGPIPDRALSSTALRCRETWQALAEAAGLPESFAVDFEAGLYNASADDLLHALAGVEEAPSTLLLLAHNPGISMLALQLAGGREAEVEQLQGGFTPASVACFEIDGPWSAISPRSARLQRFERT